MKVKLHPRLMSNPKLINNGEMLNKINACLLLTFANKTSCMRTKALHSVAFQQSHHVSIKQAVTTEGPSHSPAQKPDRCQRHLWCRCCPQSTSQMHLYIPVTHKSLLVMQSQHSQVIRTLKEIPLAALWGEIENNQEAHGPWRFADMMAYHKRPSNYVSMAKTESRYLKWLSTNSLMHAK